MENIIIKVIAKNGGNGCEANYKVGDSWKMEDGMLPGGICVGAMSALLPWITCIKYNANIPWSEPKKITVCCTDPDYPVVFEIRREE